MLHPLRYLGYLGNLRKQNDLSSQGMIVWSEWEQTRIDLHIRWVTQQFVFIRILDITIQTTEELMKLAILSYSFPVCLQSYKLHLKSCCFLSMQMVLNLNKKLFNKKK